MAFTIVSLVLSRPMSLDLPNFLMIGLAALLVVFEVRPERFSELNIDLPEDEFKNSGAK